MVDTLLQWSILVTLVVATGMFDNKLLLILYSAAGYSAEFELSLKPP